MAQYIPPNYIRCKDCNIPLTEPDYFANLYLCDRCKWERNNKGSGMINPNPVKDLETSDEYFVYIP